jgi:hypothetical protein
MPVLNAQQVEALKTDRAFDQGLPHVLIAIKRVDVLRNVVFRDQLVLSITRTVDPLLRELVTEGWRRVPPRARLGRVRRPYRVRPELTTYLRQFAVACFEHAQEQWDKRKLRRAVRNAEITIAEVVSRSALSRIFSE